MNGAEHVKITNFTINERLVLTELEADDANAALGILADRLYEYGFVKDRFKEAIKEREKKFPTGLPTINIGVAIPHTDAEHVNMPAIAIGVLKSPLVFQMMGMPEDAIPVDIIFMMAIKEPHAQLEMLQKLMSIIEKERVLIRMKQCVSPTQVVDIFLEFME